MSDVVGCFALRGNDDKKENRIYYCSDVHDDSMDKIAESKSTLHLGAGRRTQMGVERNEQLCGVVDIEVSEGKKEWPLPSFTPNRSEHPFKLKSVDYMYFCPTTSKANCQSA